ISRHLFFFYALYCYGMLTASTQAYLFRLDIIKLLITSDIQLS
ncbi:hypothetical protein YPPY103_2408, partial [Yersinia pestis PY-103]